MEISSAGDEFGIEAVVSAKYSKKPEWKQRVGKLQYTITYI